MGYICSFELVFQGGGEKPPTKEPPKGKNPSTTRVPTQTEERANLEHADKEIKETTPVNPIEFLP